MNDQIRQLLDTCSTDDLMEYLESCELPQIKTPKVRYTSDILIYDEWETISTIQRTGLTQYRGPDGRAFQEKEVGFIYFVFLDGLTKIGKATEIDRRLKQLSNGGHSLDVVFVAHLPDYERWEKFFHKTFDDKRIKGEWFHLMQADIEFAKRLIIKSDRNYGKRQRSSGRRVKQQTED